MTTGVPMPPVPDQPGAVPQAGDARAKRGVRISPKFIVILLILAAVLWFVLVNSQHTAIKLWVHDVSAPVWLVLLCAFVLGVICGALMARRRRAKKD